MDIISQCFFQLFKKGEIDKIIGSMKIHLQQGWYVCIALGSGINRPGQFFYGCVEQRVFFQQAA